MAERTRESGGLAATGVSDPAKSVISFKITSLRLRTPCLYVSHISSSTLRRIALLSDFPTVGAGFNAFHQTTGGGETGTGSQKKPKVDIEEHQSSMVSNIAKNSLEIRLDLRTGMA